METGAQFCRQSPTVPGKPQICPDLPEDGTAISDKTFPKIIVREGRRGGTIKSLDEFIVNIRSSHG
jgi:hypothetical protein